MKRTSTSYQFTADINCAADMLKIEELKKAVATINKINKGVAKPKRVCLRGRKFVEVKL